MSKLADELHLGCSAEKRGGSSPSARTNVGMVELVDTPVNRMGVHPLQVRALLSAHGNRRFIFGNAERKY